MFICSYSSLTGMRSNFDKNEVNNADYQGTPYDYLSIMHYGKTTFRMYGVNGNTMEGLFDPNQQLGGPELSKWDKTELNRRYQCQHEDENGKTVPASKSKIEIHDMAVDLVRVLFLYK